MITSLLRWYQDASRCPRARYVPDGLSISSSSVLGYDGRIMSGWATMGQTREESEGTKGEPSPATRA